MISFRSIYLEDFMSFRTASLEYDETGLVLVRGENLDATAADSNYSGKTNLMVEALTWGLFGVGTKAFSPGGTRLAGYTVESVVRNGAQKAAVEIKFEAQGQDYTIRRERSISGSVALLIGRSATEMQRSITVAEAQEEINRLIGFTYDTFTQSVVWGQAARRFSTAKDSERKALLGDILGLGILDSALFEVRAQLRKASDFQQKLESKCEAADERIDAAGRELEQAESDVSAAELAIDGFDKEELRRMFQKRDKSADVIQNSKQRLAVAEEEFKAVPSPEEIRSLQKKVQEEQKAAAETRSVAVDKVRRNNERIKRLRSMSGGSCPTCNQLVASIYAEKIAEGLETEIEEQKRIIKITAAAEETLYKKECEVGSLLDKRSEVADRIKSIESSIRYEEANVKHLSSRILEQEKVYNAAVLRLSNLKERVAEAQKRLDDARIRREAIDTTIEKAKRHRSDLKFWEDGFGNRGIKSMLMDEALPVLNDKTNEYLSVLTDGHLQVEFDTQSSTADGRQTERFDFIVRSPYGQGYHSASGGERRRIDFAVSLALQSLQSSSSGRTNLYILDEPFESVDEAGVEGVVRLLRKFAEEQQVAVYVVTHLSSLQQLFDRSLTVRRQGGVSLLC